MRNFFDRFAKIKHQEISQIEAIVSNPKLDKAGPVASTADQDQYSERPEPHPLSPAQKALEKNPVIVKKSLWRLAGELSIVVLFFVLAQFVVIMLSNLFNNSGGGFDIVLFLILEICLLAIITFISVYLIAMREICNYKINHHSIRYRRGVFFPREQVFAVNQVRSCDVKRSILGVVLNFGNLMIKNRLVNEEMTMVGIDNPEKIQDLLKKLNPHDVSKKNQI